MSEIQKVSGKVYKVGQEEIKSEKIYCAKRRRSTSKDN